MTHFPSKRSRQGNQFESSSTKSKKRRLQPSKHHSSRSRFLDLPAEIRNAIYRLCLLTNNQTLAIRDMHPDEYQRMKEQGQRPWRSAYTAPDHPACMCSWCDTFSSPLRMSDTRMMFETTTYIMANAKSLKEITFALLAVNHQIRQETASIFYGTNTFVFGTMSSLVPFLRDRAPDTRKHINSLQLELRIHEHNWYPSFTEHGRSEAWKRAFTALNKLPHLNLKKLRIKLFDAESNFYSHGLKAHTPQMRWLHRLAGISTLDYLGVQYIERDDIYDTSSWPLKAHDTEKELWSFLAPKMLAKVDGGDQDAEALQHHRITLLGTSSTLYGDWKTAIVDSD